MSHRLSCIDAGVTVRRLGQAIISLARTAKCHCVVLAKKVCKFVCVHKGKGDFAMFKMS